MNIHQFYGRRTIGFLVLLVILGLVAASYSFNSYIYQEKQGDGVAIEPYRASLSGEYVCLPHKDITESQIDECIFGLKTDVGEYYGIDFFLMSQTHDPLSVGQKISANGVVQVAERLSSDEWQKYPIEGIFSVTDSLEVLE